MKTLHERFARSKAWRHFLRDYCEENGLPGEEATIGEFWQEVLDSFSDNQIRDLCRLYLDCEDITAGERRELLDLLRIA